MLGDPHTSTGHVERAAQTPGGLDGGVRRINSLVVRLLVAPRENRVAHLYFCISTSSWAFLLVLLHVLLARLHSNCTPVSSPPLCNGRASPCRPKPSCRPSTVGHHSTCSTRRRLESHGLSQKCHLSRSASLCLTAERRLLHQNWCPDQTVSTCRGKELTYLTSPSKPRGVCATRSI